MGVVVQVLHAPFFSLGWMMTSPHDVTAVQPEGRPLCILGNVVQPGSPAYKGEQRHKAPELHPHEALGSSDRSGSMMNRAKMQCFILFNKPKCSDSD